MGITAISGPQVSYGITTTASGAVTEYNEERGPSLVDLGYALMDPRAFYSYDPGNAVGTKVMGFYHNRGFIDYIPFTANASAIVGSTTQAPVAGTALTLAPLSGSGAFQTTIVAPESGQTVSVIAIDSTAATLAFGSAGTVAVWNPAGGAGRCISVINTSNTNTEQYLVNGRDMYGFKMSETILASTTSTGTGVGKKAFKYITSVIPSTATTISATGVRVGFVDTFGLPIVTNFLAMTTVVVSTAPLVPTSIALSSANAVLASTVATATSTTPDARGTYASSLATAGTSATIANGTGVRISISQQITPLMVGSITAADQSSIFGITQFSAI